MKDKLKELLSLYVPISSDLNALVDSIDNLYQANDLSSLEERKKAFIEELRPYLSDYPKEMLNDFARYWLEISPKGKKYRFEKEKAFNMKLRLGTWIANQKKFSIVGMLNKKF